MGFVLSSPKIILNVYYTQVGREYLIKGTTEQSTINYFSLGDSDCNYNISQIEILDSHNILPIGFVPNLTGDHIGCIKSVADGIGQKYYIEGGTTNFKSFDTITKEKTLL